MNTLPLITVYIVSYNYGRYLQESIESVFAQTTDNWELLLIDDNSSDETAEVMNRYIGDDRIKVYHTEGIGLPSVCNLALREAKGEYIIRLDGDDVFDENALLVLGNYLYKNSELALVFPDYYLIDDFGEIYAEERRQKISHVNHLLDLPANGACAIVRKKILEDIGGYREDLGAQDGFDVWTKITKKYKCANINLPLFYYRKHQDNLTNNSHHIISARRRIKMDSIIKQLHKFRPLIAVIPCRKHFEFCEDLWKQEINGKSLLQRNIEVCIESKVLDQIVIASDTPDVNQVIKLFDDKRLSLFERDKKDTLRSVNIVSTLAKVSEKYDPDLTGISVLSYLQTPFVTSETLDEAISTLVMNRADSSIGVEEVKTALYKRTPHGLYPLNPPKGVFSDFDIVYREAGVALATRNHNFTSGSLFGPTIVNYIVSPDESLFINTNKSLEIARKIFEE